MRNHVRGFTMVEMMIAAAIAAVVTAVTVDLVKRQGQVVSAVSNYDNTVATASAALLRIREELKSCVQNPTGLSSTTAPAYNVTATSVTWRPCLGYISPTDANYSAMSSAGRVSVNNILYESYAKRILYDAATKTVRLRHLTGPGPTTTFELVLAGDVGLSTRYSRSVEEFAFFDAESSLAPPAAPTNTTFAIGFYIRLDRQSADPEVKGKVITSNFTKEGSGSAWVSGAALRQQCSILVQPETLLNSKSKPFVGP